MDNRKMIFVTIALGVLLLATLLVAQHTLRQSSTITLPDRTTESESGENSGDKEVLNALSVTPDTVQAAIRTLARPLTYCRTQSVTIFWSGGESTANYDVAVSGGVTRIDTTLTDGTASHTLFTSETAAVWYDEETDWTTVSMAELSADAMQRIPTYETVLDIPVTSISTAEYGEMNGIYCIHVKTRPDRDGYADSYWISVRSGLLLAAERTSHGTLIYRLSATEPESEAPAESLFLLPNGTKLPSE